MQADALARRWAPLGSSYHASIGEGGPSQMALEDIAALRTVQAPPCCTRGIDAESITAAARELARASVLPD